MPGYCEHLQSSVSCPKCRDADEEDTYARGVTEGRAAERRDVVEWLRSARGDGEASRALQIEANIIEAGEHVKEKP